ncbi:MAG: HmuY family protein [Spirochaetales bacterium]|nr:HmuY family protein [Spirochaetales bacterium]
MKTLKNKAFYLLGIFMILSFGSCDMLDSSEDDSSDSGSSEYSTATANVDYGDTNMRIYFDLSSGTMTEVSHDIWDLAISNGDATVIANSGDYGTGVTVYKTTSTDITEDLSGEADNVNQYTFEALDDDGLIASHQTDANPFDSELSTGYGSGTVYLVLDEDGTYYKVTFSSYGPYGNYSFDVVTGLDGTTATTVSGTVASGYDYTYFDLSSASAVSVAPEEESWDLLFARGNEILAVYDDGSDPYVAGRSYILQNTEGACEIASAEDYSIDELLSDDSLTYDSTITAIGSDWYTFDHTTYTYSVDTVTYVVKTTEENYAKFQPGTFYGSDGEKFYVTFRYLYEEDNDGEFSY